MRLNLELDVNKLDEYSKLHDLPKLHDNRGNFSAFFILAINTKGQDLILRTCNKYNK